MKMNKLKCKIVVVISETSGDLRLFRSSVDGTSEQDRPYPPEDNYNQNKL